MGKRTVWFFGAAALVVAGLSSFLVRRAVLPQFAIAQPTPDSLLNIPLEQTVFAREEFLVAYRKLKQGQAAPLYEQFLPRIGANGIRLALETAKPYCHEEAHDLGKLIFTKLRDVGESLESCADSCSSGFMQNPDVLRECDLEAHVRSGRLRSWSWTRGDVPVELRHSRRNRSL